MSADAGAAASAANQPEAMGAEPAARRARAMPAQARAEDRADAFADSSARATSAAAAAAPEAGSPSAHARSARAEARERLRAEAFVARRAAAAPADVEMALADLPREKRPRSTGSSESGANRPPDSSTTTTAPAAPQGGNESACPRALSSAPAVGDVRILPRIVRFFACSAQILMSGDRGPSCRVAAAVVAVCRACIPDANADIGTAIRVSEPMRSNSARSSSTLHCRVCCGPRR